MQEVQTANEQGPNVESKPDSLFGVCQAIGQDLGFNPFFLRLAFLGLGFFSIPATVAAYALLGIGVAASRWLFPANPESTESETKVEYGPRNAANQEDAEYLAA